METEIGPGWAVGDLDGLGQGPGFRKVRTPLGITAFGINALVLPPGFASKGHFHDEQEELYFVHRGELELTFDGSQSRRLGPGGLARVDPSTVRELRNPSATEETVVLVTGGKDGYVGRDGRFPGDKPIDPFG